MDINTYGDSNRYRMLSPLMNILNTLDSKNKRKISRFMISFNKKTNGIVIDDTHKEYVFNLIKNNYLESLNKLNCDDIIKPYIANFINAKINDLYTV